MMVFNQMRKYAGKIVYSAKESYGREFGVRLENEAGKGNLFKAVELIVRQELWKSCGWHSLI